MEKIILTVFLCCFSIFSSYAQIPENPIKKELRASILAGPGILQKNFINKNLVFNTHLIVPIGWLWINGVGTSFIFNPAFNFDLRYFPLIKSRERKGKRINGPVGPFVSVGHNFRFKTLSEKYSFTGRNASSNFFLYHFNDAHSLIGYQGKFDKNAKWLWYVGIGERYQYAFYTKGFEEINRFQWTVDLGVNFWLKDLGFKKRSR